MAYRAGEGDVALERYRAAEEIHAAAGRERERLRVRAHELRAAPYVRPPAALLPALRELDAGLGDERDAIKALAGNVLAFTLYQCGEDEEALAVGSRAAEIAEECGNQGELVHALSSMASALQELGRPEEAIADQRRAVALAEEHDARRVAPLLGNLAVTLASVGRYGEAAARARDAIAAAERAAERLFERYARLALGRALCSLGDWDGAVGEIESVKDQVPQLFVGMALAPLVVIAMARGQGERVRTLVDEYDDRWGGGSIVSDRDFRMLRGAALAIGRPDEPSALTRLAAGAQDTDYAEWPGWLTIAPARPEHWSQAQRLAGECGLVFESAVITLERADAADRAVDESAINSARATFARLGAEPRRGRSLFR